MTVEDRDMGWQRLQDMTKELNGLALDVGIFEGAGASDEGTLIAEYAAFNEFGTSTVPSRPFMRTAFDRNRTKYQSQIDRLVNFEKPDERKAMSAITALGVNMRNDIVNSIRDWSEPPNAESTVERKGFNNPLIETGGAGMMGAVTFEVRKG